MAAAWQCAVEVTHGLFAVPTSHPKPFKPQHAAPRTSTPRPAPPLLPLPQPSPRRSPLCCRCRGPRSCWSTPAAAHAPWCPWACRPPPAQRPAPDTPQATLPRPPPRATAPPPPLQPPQPRRHTRNHRQRAVRTRRRLQRLTSCWCCSGGCRCGAAWPRACLPPSASTRSRGACSTRARCCGWPPASRTAGQAARWGAGQGRGGEGEARGGPRWGGVAPQALDVWRGRIDASWANLLGVACPSFATHMRRSAVTAHPPTRISGQVLVEPLTFKALHRCLDSVAVTEAELAALLAGEGTGKTVVMGRGWGLGGGGAKF